jgi:D-amino-acid oxidase
MIALFAQPALMRTASKAPSVNRPNTRHRARSWRMVGTVAVSESPSRRRVCVVGAGIIGLTTAFRLAESGLDVTIVSRETVRSATEGQGGDSPYTSSGSGGLWWPFHIEPEEKIPDWGTVTYATLKEHAELGVGVSMREGFLLNASKIPDTLPWFSEMTCMQVVSPAEDSRIPSAYRSAMRFTSPVVEMEKYLAWIQDTLTDRMHVPVITSLDGKKTTRVCGAADWTFTNVSHYARDVLGAKCIVNCTGIGARDFSGDEAMTPGRGVLLFGKRTSRHDAIDYFVTEVVADAFVSDGKALAYAFPRGDGRFTLGGTYEEDNFSLIPSEDEIVGIRERVATIVPPLEGVEEVSRWAGLRPVRRGGVRLETEFFEDLAIAVVHNYGHGGGGVTTCWGCADDATNLVLGALR